jgi:PhzF family phenazine biosynthesis protein
VESHDAVSEAERSELAGAASGPQGGAGYPGGERVRQRIFVVDAFTSEPFRGNPAGVVLGHGDDAWMRHVAVEMKHSETAFVRLRDDGGYDLRWFTPAGIEVDLCGHATLASAHVLRDTAHAPEIVFHTRSGALPATANDDGSITLDFPVTEPTPEEPMPELFDALGIDPIAFLRTDANWFLCVVEQAATVRKLAPDIARLRSLPDVQGVYVSARGDEGYDIVSRCFAPAVGIDEDPVTGSMHCVLVAYWGPRLGKDTLHAFQASERGGEVTVTRKGDRALITGRATTVLRGELSA